MHPLHFSSWFVSACLLARTTLAASRPAPIVNQPYLVATVSTEIDGDIIGAWVHHYRHKLGLRPWQFLISLHVPVDDAAYFGLSKEQVGAMFQISNASSSCNA